MTIVEQLLTIAEHVTYLTTDISGMVPMKEKSIRHSKMCGYRKKIISDCLHSVGCLTENPSFIPVFDELTLVSLRGAIKLCTRNRVLRDWEFDRCGFETEGDLADNLMSLGVQVYNFVNVKKGMKI